MQAKHCAHMDKHFGPTPKPGIADEYTCWGPTQAKHCMHTNMRCGLDKPRMACTQISTVVTRKQRIAHRRAL
eukprot:1141123-Pelagomonas_calceolata.AAC.2